MRIRPRKRDVKFFESLPAFDWRLGHVSPLEYLGEAHNLATAGAAHWAYHVHDALSTARFGLFMAHSNQHPGTHDRASRIFIKICWFNLAVLSLQSSWDKLAHLIRYRLLVKEWKYLDRQGTLKSKKVSDENTNLWTAARHIDASTQPTPTERQLLAFVGDRETRIVRRVANNLKHGETLAWKGFEVVPVIEMEYDVQPMEPTEARPKRPDVGWLFSVQAHDTRPDGTEVATRMHYGQKRQLDIHQAVRRVAAVYRRFAPVADGITRDYLGLAPANSGLFAPHAT